MQQKILTKRCLYVTATYASAYLSFLQETSEWKDLGAKRAENEIWRPEAQLERKHSSRRKDSGCIHTQTNLETAETSTSGKQTAYSK